MPRCKSTHRLYGCIQYVQSKYSGEKYCMMSVIYVKYSCTVTISNYSYHNRFVYSNEDFFAELYFCNQYVFFQYTEKSTLIRVKIVKKTTLNGMEWNLMILKFQLIRFYCSSTNKRAFFAIFNQITNPN